MTTQINNYRRCNILLLFNTRWQISRTPILLLGVGMRGDLITIVDWHAWLSVKQIAHVGVLIATERRLLHRSENIATFSSTRIRHYYQILHHIIEKIQKEIILLFFVSCCTHRFHASCERICWSESSPTYSDTRYASA